MNAKSLLLTSLFFVVALSLTAQNDCCLAQELFDSNPVTIQSSAGNGDPENLNGCSCLSTNEHDSHWFAFEATTSGTFEFMITPDNASADFDFALYADECPCGPMTSVVSCSYVGPITPPGPFVSTGISSNPAGTFGYTGATTEFNGTVNINAGTTYYIIADNITGNGAGFTIEFGGSATIGPPPSVGGEQLDPIIGEIETCPGATESYEITPISGIDNYIWTVNPPGPNISPASGTNVAVDWTVSGFYELCVQGQDGCITTDLECISVSVTPVPSSNVTEFACFGQDFLAPNGISYSAPGFYTLIYQSFQGCDSTVFLDLQTHDPSFNDIIVDLCPGTCVTFNGEDYCEEGFFEINYPGANFQGCDSTDFLTILETPYFADYLPNPPEPINCINTVSTLNGSVSFVGSNPTYQWTDADGNIVSNAAIFDATMAGTYTLTVFFEEGGNTCEVSTEAIITEEIDGPDISAMGGNFDCQNPEVTLMGNSTTPNVTYSWSGPNGFSSTDQNPTTDEAGTYTLIVTDDAGCSSTEDVTVTGDTTEPNVSATGGSIDCTNTSVQINGNSTDPGVTYNWSGPNGFNSSEQNPSVSNGGNYILTVTGANGCTATTTATVDEDGDIPDVTATGADVDCNNPNPSINATSNTMGVSFSWTGPNGFTANIADPSVIDAGNYTVTVTAINGCTNTATVTVTVDTTEPDVTATGGTIDCQNTELGLSGNSNTAGATYNWTGPNGFSSTEQNPTVNEAGTYTLTVMAPNGCTAQSDAVVTQDAAIPDLTAAGGTLDCNTTEINLSASSSDPTVVFDWSGPNGFNSTEANPEISNSGTYTIIITSSNGCTATDQVTVTEDVALPDANAVGGELTCTATAVTISGNTSTPGATINWSGPGGFTSTEASPDVTEIGDYILTVTGVNGCTATATAIVTQDADLPNATAVGGTINCDITDVEIQGNSTTPGVTFEWSGPNGFSETDLNVTVTEPGQYVLTVTAASGCSTTATALVALDNEEPVLTATSDVITCDDNQTTILTTSTDIITAYIWNGPGGFTSTDASPVVTSAGNYTVVATGDNGCEGTFVFEVEEDQDLPDISAVGGTLTCDNTSIIVEGSSTTMNTTFQWSGPNGFTSTDQNPSVDQPGLYTLIVLADNGCSISEDVNVVDDTQAPDIDAVGATLDCNIPETTLTGSSSQNVVFNWTGPNGFVSDEATPLVDEVGNYNLIITADNGCTADMMVVVDGDFTTPMVVASGGSIDCTNPQTALSVSSDGVNDTYIWSGPNAFTSIDPNPVISEGGQYTITVTGENGCTSSEIVTVDESSDLPDVEAIGGTIGCDDGELTLVGNSGTPDVTFSWTGPNGFTSDLQNPDVTEAGGYTLTVTAPNGCEASSDTEVIVDAEIPDIITLGGTLSCNFTEINIEVSATDPNVQFEWTGPNGFTSIEDTPLVSEIGDYTVIATGSNGCTTASSAIVDGDFEEPDATATGGIITCADPVATLTGNSTTPGVTYLWIGSNGFTSTDPIVDVTEAGNYGLVVTAPNGCTTSISDVEVEQDADVPVAVVEGGTLDCQTTSIILNSDVNQTDLVYNWTGPGGFTSSEENPEVTEPGNYTLVVTAANDCSATATANVDLDEDLPIISINNPEQFDCNTNEVTIDAGNSSAGADLEIAWTTNTGIFISGENSLTPVVGTSGDYTITIIDNANGCSASETITVTESDETPSEAFILINDPTCFGDADGSIIIDSVAGGVPPYMYSLDGGPFTTSNFFLNLIGGGYEITIQDAEGCEYETTRFVNSPSELGVVLLSDAEDNSIVLGQEVELEAGIIPLDVSDSVNVSWSASSGIEFLFDTSLVQIDLPLQTTLYEVNIVDQKGCTASANIQITVDAERPFFIPNVFSPNDDGINDDLQLFGGPSVMRVKNYQIFNRWGETVFVRTNFLPDDKNAWWNGRHQGQVAQDGVYVFFAEVEFIDGVTEIFKGDVTIIK